MAWGYFDKKDPEFKHWLDEHPGGFVLNCYRTGKLHTAICDTYRVHGKMTHKRPKACSTSLSQLLGYAAQEGIEANRCQRCWGLD